MPRRWMRRVAAWTLRVALVLTTALLLCVGFGTGAADRARLRAFAEAVERWGRDPDFCDVSREYVTLGHEAMSARCCGVSAARVVMALRSVPGIPKAYSVNPTSGTHYDAFERGPLSAYLHLSSEQGVADGVRMLEELSRAGEVSDERIRAMLGSFDLEHRPPTDAGAVASVRRLVADVQPSRTLVIRDSVPGRLAPHVATVARRRGAPTDPTRMTREQQRLVWAALDAYVRDADEELWRTKQVSDFLGGIWAHGFGRIYQSLIEWVLWLQQLARVAGVMLACVVAVLVVRGVRPHPRGAARVAVEARL